MKRLRYILLLLVSVLILSVCGCITKQEEVEEESMPTELAMDAVNTGDDTGSDFQTDEMTQPPVEENELPVRSPEERAIAMEAFRTVLTDISQNYIRPDGTLCEYDNNYPMSDNTFAICDVDKDYKEELIVNFSTSYMAGMFMAVYDYNDLTGEIMEEISEFPAVTFYDNGIITADFSHNQGLAGDSDFWPYSIYQFNAESNTYHKLAMIDAWSANYAQTDYSGNAFPSEKDLDGNQMLYFVMEGDYDTSNPIDDAQYTEWVNGYLEGAGIMELDYMNMTEENIAAIQ